MRTLIKLSNKNIQDPSSWCRIVHAYRRMDIILMRSAGMSVDVTTKTSIRNRNSNPSLDSTHQPPLIQKDRHIVASLIWTIQDFVTKYSWGSVWLLQWSVTQHATVTYCEMGEYLEFNEASKLLAINWENMANFPEAASKTWQNFGILLSLKYSLKPSGNYTYHLTKLYETLHSVPQCMSRMTN